jgi:CMP-N-acetylneuraminic acid synthetase
MEILGLVPARLNSKGIPRKSLAPLAGRPLVEYTFEAARGAQTLTRVVVSTDDPDLAALARAQGIEVPFMRPAPLAGDDTPMLEVMRHAIGWLRQAESYESAVIVLLQPTSPLRQASDIDEAVRRLLETGADVTVSVVDVPHHFAPESLMVEEGTWLAPLKTGNPVLRRQDKPRYFARNGPAVLAARTSYLESCGHLYEGRVVGHPMDRRHSVDIDGPEDLLDAEDAILRTRHGEVSRRG